MKVAIPSNDKININKSFLNSEGFIIYQIDDHNVVDFEYRENSNKSVNEVVNILDDCSSFICNKIEPEIKEVLKGQNKQILKTLEENVKKAMLNMMCRV